MQNIKDFFKKIGVIIGSIFGIFFIFGIIKALFFDKNGTIVDNVLDNANENVKIIEDKIKTEEEKRKDIEKKAEDEKNKPIDNNSLSNFFNKRY